MWAEIRVQKKTEEILVFRFLCLQWFPAKKYPGSSDLKGWPRHRAPLSRLFNSLVLLANPIVLWLGTGSFSLLFLLVPKQRIWKLHLSICLLVVLLPRYPSCWLGNTSKFPILQSGCLDRYYREVLMFSDYGAAFIIMLYETVQLYLYIFFC